MFRSFILLCIVALFAFSSAFAQNVPTKPELIRATPEILALYDQSLQALAQAEPNAQAGGLFQLLGFAVNFEDKAPAQRSVNALLNLAASFESEELRSQLYEGVANALCDMEKFSEAVGVINRIPDTAKKYEPQLNLAITIIRTFESENESEGQDKKLPAFDTSELLQQAIAGASAVKDSDLELAARIFLGRELARQGKKEESAAVFAEVSTAAQKIEDVTKRNDSIGVLFQSQVQYDQMEGARATLKLVTDPDHKRLCASVLIREEQFADAETLLQGLPVGELKDAGYFELAVATIKTITEGKIGEFAALITAEEQRERFLQRMVVELQKNDRSDVAVQLSKRLKDVENTKLVLLLGEVETRMEKKQFVEAIASVEKSEVDVAVRQHFKRQILMTQYRETHEDSIASQIAETYSAEEKMTLAELNESAKQAVAMTNPDEQMNVFLEVLQGQFQLMDIANAKQTITLVSAQLDKEKDVVRLVQYRLLLARLQNEMQDKQAVKENLTKLTQSVSAVQDLKAFKGLLPEQQPQLEPVVQGAEGGPIKLDLPAVGNEPEVDESAIRNQLFQVYLLTANLLTNADAQAESAAAIAKAKELANAETTAEGKAEKLLLLAQILAGAEEEQ